MKRFSAGWFLLVVVAVVLSGLSPAAAAPSTVAGSYALPRHCLSHVPAGPADYQEAFDYRSGGWAGADGALPITLPDHRVLWLFGDTFIGAIDNNNALQPGWAFPRNSVQVQSGRCFTPLTGGTAQAPASFLPNQGDIWFWPTGGYVDMDAHPPVVRIVATELGPFSGGFGFAVIGTHIFTLSLPRLTIIGDQAAPYDPTITNMPSFGRTIMRVGRMLYLYGDGGGFETNGVDPNGPFGAGVFVARVAANRINSGAWQYWVGSGWSTDVMRARAMSVGGISDPATFWQQDVVPWGRGFLTTARILPGGLFAPQLYAWTAPTPAGPWQPTERDGQPANIIPADVTFPQPRLHYGGYLVTDVPGTSTARPMLVFSTNGSGCGGDVQCTSDNDDGHNVLLYGPHFVGPVGLP